MLEEIPKPATEDSLLLKPVRFHVTMTKTEDSRKVSGLDKI